MLSINTINSLGYSIVTGAVMSSEYQSGIDWEYLRISAEKALLEEYDWELANTAPWWEALEWDKTEPAHVTWNREHTIVQSPSYVNPWNTPDDGMPARSKCQAKSKAKWLRKGKAA